jgi:hypothetical protein
VRGLQGEICRLRECRGARGNANFSNLVMLFMQAHSGNKVNNPKEWNGGAACFVGILLSWKCEQYFQGRFSETHTHKEKGSEHFEREMKMSISLRF